MLELDARGYHFVVDSITPCLADQKRIRVVGRCDSDLSSILDVLFLHFPNANYSKDLGCVMAKKQGQMISIFATGKIALTYQRDEEEVVENLKYLAKIFQSAGRYLLERGSPPPELVKRKESLNALELNKLLPGTDCGECGESGCFAFATRLQVGELGLDDCPQLRKPEYSKMKDKLKGYLQPVDLEKYDDHHQELAEFLGL